MGEKSHLYQWQLQNCYLVKELCKPGGWDVEMAYLKKKKKKRRFKKDNFSWQSIAECFEKWESACRRQRRAVLTIFGFCHPKREPKTKRGFGAVSRRRTIAFSSESLSPRAKEQSRQMHSKVKGTDNSGKARKLNGWPLGFRLHKEQTTARGAWSNLIRTILQRSWAIFVVSTKFLLYCSLCHKIYHRFG